jgi:hypothetical protein
LNAIGLTLAWTEILVQVGEPALAFESALVPDCLKASDPSVTTAQVPLDLVHPSEFPS